jgi:hypothetical protein
LILVEHILGLSFYSFLFLSLFQEANDELEAVLMNRSLEQGKAVLSQTNREGTSIEMELRNMDDNQVRKGSTQKQIRKQNKCQSSFF